MRRKVVVRLDAKELVQLDAMAMWYGLDRGAILRRIVIERFAAKPVAQ